MSPLYGNIWLPMYGYTESTVNGLMPSMLSATDVIPLSDWLDQPCEPDPSLTDNPVNTPPFLQITSTRLTNQVSS
jgi:hypothetical protein